MSTAERALRAAAFGDPVPGVFAHPADVLRGASAAVSAECPVSRWLAAVVLGAHGNYAAGAAVLEPLCRGTNGLLASLASSALASHRRQLGGHELALRLDGAAARSAVRVLHSGGEAAPEARDEDGLDPTGALGDALLGLAADNLGLGRLSAARAHLARAATVCTGWRGEVRLDWVRAELALAAGVPADSVSPAKRAAAVARERGAGRHRIKSDLVLAAALAATGRPEEVERAAALASFAAADARSRGLRSLSWPAGLLAADLGPDRADLSRSRVTDELYGVLLSSDPLGRRCARRSMWVPI